MDKLTEEQKKALLKHIKDNEDIDFVIHAQWAMDQFGVAVTAKECYTLFVDDMYG